MYPLIKCPTENKTARSSNKECFTLVCCSEGTVSSLGHESCKVKRHSAERRALERGNMQQREKVNHSEKSTSLKRKNNVEITAKTLPRSNENSKDDTSQSVSQTVEWSTGGLSGEGKVMNGKASKKKKKPTVEVADSELQISFHDDHISLTEGSLTNNHRSIEEVKKGGKKSLHLQRRILANARERSRVHKLGEAFRMLRNAIPSFSIDQKLSKLSTLRIAVSYISALGSLLELDRKAGAKQVFTASVNECTFALQSEFGRAKGAGTYKAKVGKSTKYKKAKNNK